MGASRPGLVDWVTRWWTAPIPEQAIDRTSEQSKTLTEPSFPFAMIAFVNVPAPMWPVYEGPICRLKKSKKKTWLTLLAQGTNKDIVTHPKSWSDLSPMVLSLTRIVGARVTAGQPHRCTHARYGHVVIPAAYSGSRS